MRNLLRSPPDQKPFSPSALCFNLSRASPRFIPCFSRSSNTLNHTFALFRRSLVFLRLSPLFIPPFLPISRSSSGLRSLFGIKLWSFMYHHPLCDVAHTLTILNIFLGTHKSEYVSICTLVFLSVYLNIS